MHTFIWNDEENDRAGEVVINHNGDYSGDAIIRTYAPNGDLGDELTVPVAALEAFVKGVVGDKLVSLLEQNGYA